MNSTIILSIIVVNFETPEYTLGCLRSVFAHAPACSFEVILIDNGSRDDSLLRIREEIPQVIGIETGENIGFSRANNLGISNARGEFILLLNSDTLVLDKSLDRMVEYLFADPKVGAVGPKQVDAEGRLQLSWGVFPTFFSELLRKVLHYRLSINDFKVREYLEGKFSGQARVDWVSGSCLMMRRSVLNQTGFLDPHFFMYFEDIDLCRRIQDKGWQVHFSSDMSILHYGGVSAKKNLLKVLVEYRHSQIYFARKYYGLSGVFALKLFLFIKYSIYFVRWTVAYMVFLLAGGDKKSIFIKLLLCKKTIELIFSPERPVRQSL